MSQKLPQSAFSVKSIAMNTMNTNHHVQSNNAHARYANVNLDQRSISAPVQPSNPPTTPVMVPPQTHQGITFLKNTSKDMNNIDNTMVKELNISIPLRSSIRPQQHVGLVFVSPGCSRTLETLS
eukprot:311049_1